MSSSREFRNVYPTKNSAVWESASNFCKLGAGMCGPNIRVNEDGSMAIAPDAYADDVVAFVLAAIRGNPTIDTATKAHLARFLDDMDARAVARHGYSAASPRERNYEWKSVAACYTEKGV